MERNIKEIVSQMTLEEKAGMCSGKDYWNLKGVERLGIPTVKVSEWTQWSADTNNRQWAVGI